MRLWFYGLQFFSRFELTVFKGIAGSCLLFEMSSLKMAQELL
jgi:hypothetical protein